MPLHSLAATPPTTTIQSAAKQQATNSIVKSLLNVEASTTFDPKIISYKEVGALVNKAVENNPAIFYYKGVTSSSDGKIYFKYDGSKQTILDKKKKIDAQVNNILKTVIKKDMRSVDKVKAIHDYLVSTVAYDYDNLKKNTIPSDSYSIYGALIRKVAVCDGYSKSMQLLLNKVGVETLYISGSSKGLGHSWNMVKLDGAYYHIDTTWDDPVPNKPGYANYNYFLLTNAGMKKDHQWNEKAYPVATNTKYSYFQTMNKMTELNGYYYYSSAKDNVLYKMDKKTLKTAKVIPDRAPYFAIYGQWIYYSNYSNGGYLYKVKLDGKGKTKVNSTRVEDLYTVKNVLYFKNYQTKKNQSITLK